MLADEEQEQQLRLVASEKTIEIIKSAAEADTQYQTLKRQIQIGWPSKIAELPPEIRKYYTLADELLNSDDLVYMEQRVVVPREMRAHILERLPSSHIGVNGCIRRAHESVFYPGITRDIKEVVGRCAICETFHRANQRETLLSHPTRDVNRNPENRISVLKTKSGFAYSVNEIRIYLLKSICLTKIA